MTLEPNSKTRDALILVDLQHDFLSGGALAVPTGEAIIPIANKLQSLFTCIVATRDWHPANHGSFATSHPGAIPGDIVDLAGLQQILWPVHCVQESRGAALTDQLDAVSSRDEVFKGVHADVDSYSGFFDNDHRHATGLDDVLRKRGVQRIFIMGLATEYCVKFTALDAIRLGYETYLVQDGCRGVNLQAGDVAKALNVMRDAGVIMINSEEVAHIRARQRATEKGEAASDPDRDVLLAETEHLQLVRRGGWDFVCRTTASSVVAILAVTPDQQILLVEQYRTPVGQRVIELPAGLVADNIDTQAESLEDAAQRELLEETGYRAESVRCVFTGASSAGLTNEETSFVIASNLTQVTPGGGDRHEDITVLRVPLDQVDAWLRQQIKAGRLIDARVPSGIYLLHHKW